VVEASPAGKVKGRALIALRFNRVVVADTPYTIRTARISREAEATKGEDAKKVGIGAGAGAVIGAIAGGKKGAAIGTAVGAGAGGGAVLATKGKEVSLASGVTVRTTIDAPVKINAPM
jgi:outer membrane lipoprotein SlyB